MGGKGGYGEWRGGSGSVSMQGLGLGDGLGGCLVPPLWSRRHGAGRGIRGRAGRFGAGGPCTH